LADRKVGDIDHLLNFALPFDAYLSGFKRHQGPQFRFVLAQRISDLADDFASFRGRNPPPVFKRLSGLLNDGFIILFFAGNPRRPRTIQRSNLIFPVLIP
jgi:hypothetical protein